MRVLVLLGAAGLLLSSCATTKPPPTFTPTELAHGQAIQDYWQAAPVDSLPPSQPVWSQADSLRWAAWKEAAAQRLADSLPPAARPSLATRIGQALGLVPKPRRTDTIRAPAGAVVNLPRKIKNAQVVIQLGTGNTNGNQASLGKSKAPTQQATEGSTQASNGSGQQQAQVGDGNQAAPQTATTEEAPGPLAVLAAKLAGPPGIVLGIVLAGAVVWAVWYFWFLIPARRKRATEPEPPAAV